MSEAKKGKFNIGFFVFVTIIIYIVFVIIVSFTSSSYESFEVTHGSLQDFEVHTGVAIRDEIDVKATKSGKVHYLANEADKISCGGNVYTFSDIETKKNSVKGDFSVNKQKEIESEIQAFQKSYNSQEYEKTYEFLNKNLYSEVEIEDEELFNEIDAQKASTDGVVSFYIDNLENLTVDKINQDILNEKKYSRRLLRNNISVKKGDIIYKLVTNEDWHIACNISNKEYNKIKSKKNSTVTVQFLKDGTKTSAKIQAKKINDKHYAILNITDFMPRFISDRFLSIKIIYDGASGLKIPMSSITTKNFLVVPVDYIIDYNDTGNDYVIKKHKKKYEHVQVDVYYMDIKTNYAYILSDSINKGDIIYNPDGGELTLHKVLKLKGVYNINKGYALFKRVNILFKTDDYAIIEEGTSYGISNYDYIAEDGKKAKKDEL